VATVRPSSAPERPAANRAVLLDHRQGQVLGQCTPEGLGPVALEALALVLEHRHGVAREPAAAEVGAAGQTS